MLVKMNEKNEVQIDMVCASAISDIFTRKKVGFNPDVYLSVGIAHRLARTVSFR